MEALFEDWQDYDIAKYHIACLLGLLEGDDNFESFRRAKGVFAASHPVGDVLYRALEDFVKVGMFETNDEGQYRWNRAFNAYWYRQAGIDKEN